METVVEPPIMPTHAQRQEEYQREDPTFVHARPYEERSRRRRSYRAPIDPTPPPPSVNAPVGAWTVIETVARWWYWIFLAGIVGLLGGYFFGLQFFQTGFVASVELMRLDPGASMEYYKPRTLTDDGFANVLKTPELVQDVAKMANPPLNPDDLAKRIKVVSSGESEIFTLALMANSPERAVELANLYAEKAKEFTGVLQQREVGEAIEILKSQLAQMDGDLQNINSQMRTASAAPAPSTRGNAVREQLEKEELALLNLRSRYQDVYPLVQEQIAKVEQLKKQLVATQPTNAPAGAGAGVQVHDVDFSALQRQNLDSTRLAFVTRLREAQSFGERPPGYFTIFAQAENKSVQVADAKFKIIMAAVLGGMVSFGACLVLVLFIEVFDQRIKTEDDLKRVTGLRMLGTLGDIRRMTQAEQNNWAFRTWTSLQCSLSPSPNHGLICGITSAGHGEGRSTWVNLLSKAAGQCGFRVLTIGTVQVADEETLKNCSAEERNGEAAEPANAHVNGHASASDGSDYDPTETTALMTRILTSPSQVTQQLTGHDPQQFVHIPLPGWVWNLQRRKQWQGALSQWKRIEHVVIFVELPPASMPETVLLATKLPNVIWLARSGKPRASSTRAFIQTLRDARVNLVGSVMNKDTGASVKKCFSRWLSGWVLAAILSIGSQADAQEEATRTSVSNISFSASSRTERAEWQKRFTLGPGDVLNISLFGQADADRKDVPIGPDGRISFLQAIDVVAAGLTVDELRAKLDEDLARFYRAPRTIVSPVSIRSKKYYVLGKVTNRGVYSLDRPTSLIEAVARAHGIETGLMDENNITELADLQRSFLMRGGKRVEVNLEKLFQEGDLSQNTLLEPEDFLFFASTAMKEVFVLGEVQAPGPLPWTANVSAISAIANRGGFNQRAYKSKVLVIRGSLNNPRTFIVNAWGTFEAKHLDFRLEPKDIVYVHHRPFIYAEELLDAAISTFLQSVSAGLATEKVHPLITKPILRFTF